MPWASKLFSSFIGDPWGDFSFHETPPIRDQGVRNPLEDLTHLVKEQHAALEQKIASMESWYVERKKHQEAKDRKWSYLERVVRKLAEDLTETKEMAIAAKIESGQNPIMQEIIDELRKRNTEQRELLEALSDTWRSDFAQRQGEIIECIRSTASEQPQTPLNIQGCLDEFSKALATEVRMLAGDVGKLREERRSLQHELGYMWYMKSKFGPGGEFDPEWEPLPPPNAPGAPTLDPPQPPEQPPQTPKVPPTAKPAWRTVHRSQVRRKKKEKLAPTATGPQNEHPAPTAGPQRKQSASTAEAPPPLPHLAQPKPTYPRSGDPWAEVQSWTTWHLDPGNVPWVESTEPHLLVPEHQESIGLFGPRSPSPMPAKILPDVPLPGPHPLPPETQESNLKLSGPRSSILLQ